MTTALPCPLCGSTNITSNEWSVDGEHAKQFSADEFSEIWAYECNDCLAAAPVQSWQKRWIDGEPPLDTWVILVYRKAHGGESRPIMSIRTTDIEHRPTIRWTHIPAHDTEEHNQ